MNYKESIKQSMEMLAQDSKFIILGYNVCYGSQGYGTFMSVPEEQRLETPLAENLMVGLASGLALEGYKPLVFFERHDFVLNALDAIVNHVDKFEYLSKKQFKVPMIIRATVGSKQPLDPGPQHTQDFAKVFKELISFPIYEPKNAKEVLESYSQAKKFEEPVMIIERKELYENE